MNRVRLLLLLSAAFGPWPVSVGELRAQAAADSGRGVDVASQNPPPAAFSRVEARRFLAVVALGGLAYSIDELARKRVLGVAGPTDDVRSTLAKVGNVYGVPAALALGPMMWGVGRIAGRPTLAASGLRAVEAVVVSGVVTAAIKESMGRARPDVATAGRADWQLFRGARTEGGDYQSFASGHATAAFAFATAVTGEVALRAPQHTRLVGITTFGLAGLTAYARMHDDRHWLSDVTVGAGIGTITALAIRRWHVTRPDNGIDRLFLSPIIETGPLGRTKVGLRILAR